MRLLPSLMTPAGELALPLSDAAATRLIAALLADAPAARRDHVDQAIRHDPPLALWVLCRAASRGRHDLRTVAALAEWFSDVALDELAVDGKDQADEHAGSQPTDPVAAVPWDSLAAVALGVAWLSARIAAARQIDSERAYLAGLVHAAGPWLSLGIGSAAVDARSSLLPDWLTSLSPAEADAVSASAEPRPATAADCVALARRAIFSGDCSRIESLGIGFDPLAHQERVELARQTWSAATGAGEQLFRLVARLRRLELLEHEFQTTLEREKLDSLKELAYGAGHEINNPLANISARAQTLLQEERDPERRRRLAAINTQAFRAHEMIADMMLFARPPQPKLETIEVASLLGKLIAELAPAAADQGTELVFHAPAAAGRLTVAADRTQLAVAVRALCVNALEALVTGGCVELAIARGASDARTGKFSRAWRDCADYRLGQRARHRARGAATSLRSVLFRAGSGPRLGLWAFEVLADCRHAWRPDRGVEHAGPRRRLHDHPAGARKVGWRLWAGDWRDSKSDPLVPRPSVFRVACLPFLPPASSLPSPAFLLRRSDFLSNVKSPGTVAMRFDSATF